MHRTSPVERTLVVSVHDVAPATMTKARRWLANLETFGVRGALLAVPGPWRGRDPAGAPAWWLRSLRSA